jgi:hypothetical protein
LHSPIQSRSLIIATDINGNGLTSGNGLTLSYNDATILSIPLYDTGTFYEGAWYWIAEIGDCDDSGNGNGSNQDQGGSGDDDDDDKGQGGLGEDDDGKDQGGSGDDDDDKDQGGSDHDDNGSSGNDDSCFDATVALTTDSEADEMALLVYDLNDVDADFILMYDFGDLVDNSSYEEEISCLDTSGCYVVLLLDQGSDGFASTGGLEVALNGDTILSVGPGDIGEYDTDLAAMWWAVAFGNCDF